MRIALIGSVSSSVAALRGLIAGGAEVVCVLGLAPEHAAGVSDYHDLQPLAAEHGLPYCGFRKVAAAACSDFLRQHQPDLLLVIGLSQLLPDEMLAIAPQGGLGFHPTMLPEGRGRAPVAWTIYLDQPAAMNLFFLTDEADAGDLVAQVPVPVEPDDTSQTLIDRTNVILERTITELCPALNQGQLPRTPQAHERATWYGRRGPEDGRIDWGEDAPTIYRLIRAASRPYPGAYTHLGTDRRIVWNARPAAEARHIGTIGQIVAIDPEQGLLVQCGSGHLWLTEVADEAGNVLDSRAFRVGQTLGLPVETLVEQLLQRVAALEAGKNA